jgi:hypothetical protein
VSNPESFIEEVTEEVRRDRLFAMFRKYGWIAGLLVVLIVGGAAYTEWQAAKNRAQAQAFGDSLLGALDQNDAAARREALANASTQNAASPDAIAIKDLLLASDPAEDRAGSIAALEAISANPAISQTYRDLADLRRVILVGTEMEIAARRAILDPIAAPGRPFRPLALEQMAYLSIEAGEIDAAITQLRALSQDQESPPGLRQRATQMIVALGGESAAG